MSDKLSGPVQWRHPPANRWLYCPTCQTGLVDQIWDGVSRRYCPHCGFVYWERPLPAVAAVISHPDAADQVVLVKRRYPPEQGEWTLPGGGIEAGESSIDAAIREAREETGLIIVVDSQLGTWSTPNYETVITFYRSHPVGGQLEAGTDAVEARWFMVGQTPRLAFSTHQDALERFRGNLNQELP